MILNLLRELQPHLEIGSPEKPAIIPGPVARRIIVNLDRISRKNKCWGIGG